MTLNQISVFLENRPGKLQELTDTLAKHGINMRALSLAETSEFGIVRIIVDDVQATAALLTKEAFVYTVTPVVGVAIPDTPGGLNQALHALSLKGINVEYMYAFLGRKDPTCAYMIFYVQQPEAAAAALQEKDVACISQQELAGL